MNARSLPPLLLACILACHIQKGSESSVDSCTCADPPVADIGDASSAAVGSTVTLDGTTSFSCDGSPVTCTWAVMSAPNDSWLTTSGLDVSVPCKCSFVANAAGTYILDVTATDSCGRYTHSEPVVVTAYSTAP